MKFRRHHRLVSDGKRIRARPYCPGYSWQLLQDWCFILLLFLFLKWKYRYCAVVQRELTANLWLINVPYSSSSNLRICRHQRQEGLHWTRFSDSSEDKVNIHYLVVFFWDALAKLYPKITGLLLASQKGVDVSCSLTEVGLSLSWNMFCSPSSLSLFWPCSHVLVCNDNTAKSCVCVWEK